MADMSLTHSPETAELFEAVSDEIGDWAAQSEARRVASVAGDPHIADLWADLSGGQRRAAVELVWIDLVRLHADSDDKADLLAEGSRRFSEYAAVDRWRGDQVDAELARYVALVDLYYHASATD